MCFNKIIEKQFGFLPCILKNVHRVKNMKKDGNYHYKKKSAYYDCPLCDSFCSGGLQQ